MSLSETFEIWRMQMSKIDEIIALIDAALAANSAVMENLK